MRRKLIRFGSDAALKSVGIGGANDGTMIESWSSSSAEDSNSKTWVTCSDDSGLAEPEMVVSTEKITAV